MSFRAIASVFFSLMIWFCVSNSEAADSGKSKYRNAFYFGTSFNLEQYSFSSQNGNVSNGFVARPPMIGLGSRIGYEIKYRNFYFATEGFASISFGLDVGGSYNIGDVYSLRGPLKGSQTVGFNIKPGFSFNENTTSLYLIAGMAYTFVDGTIIADQNKAFQMSGFALNYGIGIKHDIVKFLSVFFEFNGTAPIRGAGNIGLDRTASLIGGGTSSWLPISLESYQFNLGLDVKF